MKARAVRTTVRTAPQPLPVQAHRVVLVGTGLWIVATVVAGTLWATSAAPAVLFWTALAGSVLGGAGLLLIARHHAAGRV